MTKRLSLNLATLFPLDLEQKLYAAGSAGFRAVGMLLSDLAREGEAGFTELHLSQLAVSELVAISGWADLDHATRTVALHHAEQAFEIAARVRADLVVAEAPRHPLDDLALADRFGELCRLAQPYRVRVGLEFSGSAEQVKDVASAWQVVENAGLDNGGLVIDTFHFHKGASSLEMFEPIPGDRIFLIQIADCPEIPRHEMQSRHRIYPGAGAIPFEPLLAVLYDKNYAGYYSLELYNEDYWAEDPLVVAKDALRSMRQL